MRQSKALCDRVAARHQRSTLARTLAHAIAALLLFVALSAHAPGTTYDVGPREKYQTISQVAGGLAPGDVALLHGDITDCFTLTRSGNPGNPVTIRGVTTVRERRIVRPRIRPRQTNGATITCRGDWNVVEGVELMGRPTVDKNTIIGVRHDCDHLVVRNCYFHHFNFKAILGTPNARSITITFCEFDSCGSVPLNGKTVDIWSWKPGAVATVEHCYFHDSLNEALLKSHCTRNVIRYNWFENAYQQSIKITDRVGKFTPERPDNVYPMHSDIVGNVFIQGRSPGLRFSVLSLGGQAADETGTEGDFNIAHNLFVMDSCVNPPTDRPAHVLVTGNVDHVRAYNNVFLDMGGSGCALYLRGETWDSEATTEFIRRRASPDPVVEGSNNWIFERSIDVPELFTNALRGMNPRFVDLLNGDYRPRKESPLTGAGLWPLPRGRVVDLAPEFEPQRGIPADLKPKLRRKAIPPSIGPFEAPEGQNRPH
jgi:hypothetical protein